MDGGCYKCGRELSANKNLKKKEQFIQEALEIHGNLYNYSLVDYKKTKDKIKIICKIQGIFEQSTEVHLRGNGCTKCANNKTSERLSSNTEEFIKKAKQIHGKKYDYSLVNYKNARIPIIIICNIHGKFNQTPEIHLRGSGCIKCKESKGEKKIRIFLENNNINYEKEKRFKNCKYKHSLPFDFYLPDFNLCIEYDGGQHFMAVDYFGGSESFKNLQKKDEIRNEYCKINNINLLRIHYKEFENIETILNNKLKEFI